MKKTFAFAIALLSLSASAARADGFTCQTEGEDLVVKAYNHVDATQGTRDAAVMILSDPAVSVGNKTIARFTDVNETIGNVGAQYSADVDLRFNDSSLKGRNIGGTKLGFLKTIILDVDFSYSSPVADMDVISGTLTLVKRDGQEITHSVNCRRYLKN
jgi:hypothetical protein